MGKYEYSCLNHIDIFGIPPIFTIRGRSTFQTHTGSILTIICILIILIYISFFLNQMINHKSPNLNSEIYYDEIPIELNLNKNNFSFVFGLKTKSYKTYIDESIYKVNAFQTKITLDQNGIYNIINEPLNIIKCNEYNFTIIPEQFSKLPLKNLYCLNNNINLKGDYMKEYWHYVNINFTKCENSTEKNLNKNYCKSENEINEILNGGSIGLFFPDNSFNQRNYKNPYKSYVKNLYQGFSINNFEDISLYIKLVEIITDTGYFFDDKKSIFFSSYDYMKNNIIYFQNINNFLSLSINVSTKREIYRRSYIKLQTIISNVGGMLKIVLLIGEYSVYFIRMLLYKNYILEFFNLDESVIRLKEVRKKYQLKGNHSIKNHFESIFSNFSNFDNASSNNNINIKYNVSYDNKGNNIKLRIIGDKEDKNSIFVDNIINKQLSNKNDNIKTNNFFIKSDIISLSGKNNKLSLKSNYQKQNERVKEFYKSDLSLKTSNNNFSHMPKTKLRIIKVPGFFSDFICKKNTLKTIKQIHENYKEIQFLLDIIHYLKSQNELNVIEKILFDEEQRKALSYTYSFISDFSLERKGYEYMIKHEKNKFDKKEFTTTN